MGACGVRDVVRMDAGELTDSEGATDQSDCESEVVRVGVPGFLKRTYGVDLASDASLERRRKSAKLDEQLDGLRAVLPDVATRVSAPSFAMRSIDFLWKCHRGSFFFFFFFLKQMKETLHRENQRTKPPARSGQRRGTKIPTYLTYLD
jgi:hypothetical protein